MNEPMASGADAHVGSMGTWCTGRKVTQAPGHLCRCFRTD